jgi:hypothetical protein
MTLTGNIHRHSVHFCLGIQVCTCLEQKRDDLPLASLNGKMQRRPPLFEANIDSSP